VRNDDRGFRVGDTLRLREWDPTDIGYSGRETERTITYILKAKDCPAHGLTAGFVVLGLDHLRAAGLLGEDAGLRRRVEKAEAWLNEEARRHGEGSCRCPFTGFNYLQGLLASREGRCPEHALTYCEPCGWITPDPAASS
jgi:hypothetical protein